MSDKKFMKLNVEKLKKILETLDGDVSRQERLVDQRTRELEHEQRKLQSLVHRRDVYQSLQEDAEALAAAADLLS